MKQVQGSDSESASANKEFKLHVVTLVALAISIGCIVCVILSFFLSKVRLQPTQT
jgi:hypothetical protein